MDFAPTMIAEAIRRHPGIDFRVGDAEAIPLADASVDAVTCSFGMLHMERPERVLAEVARVLRRVIGRFAMTAWISDGEFFALLHRQCRRMPTSGCRYHLLRRCSGLGTKANADLPCSPRVSPSPASKSAPLSGPVTHQQAVLDTPPPGHGTRADADRGAEREVRKLIEQAILRGAERYGAGREHCAQMARACSR